MVTRPHGVPSSAEMAAATVSVKTPDPGLRITNGPRTAGRNQTPAIVARIGGDPAERLSVPGPDRRPAQETTPEAVAGVAGPPTAAGRPPVVSVDGPPR